MFEGFAERRIRTTHAEIHLRLGGGHFLPEEAPTETLAALEAFL